MLQRTLILALALGSTAFAQQEEPEEPVVSYQEVTTVSFTDMHIDGTLVAPQVRMYSAVRRAEFAPMIKLRANFTPEMERSVDDIK